MTSRPALPFDDLPRSPSITRMHVDDAGSGVIKFACARCGHNTGWVDDEWTVSENRRGHPCPNCNTAVEVVYTREDA